MQRRYNATAGLQLPLFGPSRFARNEPHYHVPAWPAPLKAVLGTERGQPQPRAPTAWPQLASPPASWELPEPASAGGRAIASLRCPRPRRAQLPQPPLLARKASWGVGFSCSNHAALIRAAHRRREDVPADATTTPSRRPLHRALERGPARSLRPGQGARSLSRARAIPVVDPRAAESASRRESQLHSLHTPELTTRQRPTLRTTPPVPLSRFPDPSACRNLPAGGTLSLSPTAAVPSSRQTVGLPGIPPTSRPAPAAPQSCTHPPAASSALLAGGQRGAVHDVGGAHLQRAADAEPGDGQQQQAHQQASHDLRQQLDVPDRHVRRAARAQLPSGAQPPGLTLHGNCVQELRRLTSSTCKKCKAGLFPAAFQPRTRARS